MEIQREIHSRKQVALGRHSNWEQLNVCPPCLYRLKGEIPLKYSFLAAMDGNNSLKLVDSTFRSGKTRHDNRTTDSFRWLSPEQVDRFKDEVSKKASIVIALRYT